MEFIVAKASWRHVHMGVILLPLSWIWEGVIKKPWTPDGLNKKRRQTCIKLCVIMSYFSALSVVVLDVQDKI